MKEDWKEVSLNEFVWFQRGYDLPKIRFKEGSIPVYGSTSILGYHDEFKVKGPGIITGRSGTLGVMQYSKDNFWPHNTSLWVKDFKGNNEKFAYYLLSCLDFSLFNSGGAVPTLNRNVLNAFVVNVPPIGIQQKIANILSAYDDLIENNTKRIELLEEQAKLIYEEWFIRIKFPNYENILIDRETGLPEGWENMKIGEVFKTSSGGTPSKTKEVEYYKNGDIPWVRTGELKQFILIESERYITEKGLKESSAKMFPKNTVLLAMYGNTIGETTFAAKSVSTNQACCAFLVEDDEEYLSYFIHQYLLYNKEYILNFRMGAAQENISQSIIKNIEIRMPSDDILLKFEELIKPLYLLIENLAKQNKYLQEARDILLPRLMMGIIEV